MPWEEGRSSASGNLEDFLAEETFRLGLGGGRQGLLSRERKHQEEIASVGEKLGSTPPHIPLATTSHMTAWVQGRLGNVVSGWAAPSC